MLRTNSPLLLATFVKYYLSMLTAQKHKTRLPVRKIVVQLLIWPLTAHVKSLKFIFYLTFEYFRFPFVTSSGRKFSPTYKLLVHRKYEQMKILSLLKAADTSRKYSKANKMHILNLYFFYLHYHLILQIAAANEEKYVDYE